MPINFPDAPSVNDEFTVDDKIWRWSGSTWDSVPSVVVGTAGPTGPRGVNTANTFKYTASITGGGSTTTGVVTANTTSLVSTSTLFVSHTDADSVDVTSALASAMSSTSANKATITVRDSANTSNFVQFVATSFYPSSTESRIDVTPVSDNGTVADGATVLMTIDRAGDIGPTGAIPDTSSFVTLIDPQTVLAKTFGYSFDAGSISTTSTTPGIISFTTNINGVLYWTSNLTQNFTLDFCVDPFYLQSFDSRMSVGDTMSLVAMFTNGTTPYRPTVFQIDGVPVTPKWVGGTAPSSGNASSIDMYSFNIIKTATNTFVVLASQSKFA